MQDAHCGADLEHSLLPSIHLADSHIRKSSQTNALIDMWHAMENAKHMIYITNWHFNPETKNPFDESLPNIGELLKKKAEQGKQRWHMRTVHALDVAAQQTRIPPRTKPCDIYMQCTQNTNYMTHDYMLVTCRSVTIPQLLCHNSTTTTSSTVTVHGGRQVLEICETLHQHSE